MTLSRALRVSTLRRGATSAHSSEGKFSNSDSLKTRGTTFLLNETGPIPRGVLSLARCPVPADMESHVRCKQARELACRIPGLQRKPVRRLRLRCLPAADSRTHRYGRGNRAKPACRLRQSRLRSGLRATAARNY